MNKDHHKLRDVTMWTTYGKNGGCVHTPISQLDSVHLDNIIAYIKRNPNSLTRKKLPILENEVEYRRVNKPIDPVKLLKTFKLGK